MSEKIQQPEIPYQELLDSLMEAEPETVKFRGRTHRIDWMHRRTQRMFTHIVLKEKDPEKRNVKLCACVLVNNIFVWFKSIAYNILWRWYWYVKDLDDIEILGVIDAAKKKIQYYPSMMLTTLSTGMKDTMMMMTKKEASAIQAGQAGAQPSA